MTGMQTDGTHHLAVIQDFWKQQSKERAVSLLTETSSAVGGSLVAVIRHRFLIWEAWGELDAAVIASSLQSIRDACASAKEAGERMSGFFDFTRVTHMAESVGHGLKAFRTEIGPNSALERAAVVLDSTMARINYDMASLLCPSPWEERVFPTVDEALTWLQDPKTALIDVDGLSWIV
jgi:hypothetical protein